MALKLARAGFWGGNPGAVLRAPADEVLAALQYEVFTSEYERAVFELNRQSA